MSKSNLEMIVCMKADEINKLVDETGFVNYSIKHEDLMLGQRGSLETDENFRQLLPINIFLCQGKVWAYRRTPKGNESRLHGATTIAVGGHWDMADLVCSNSVVDWASSMKLSRQREIAEEVVFTKGNEIVESLEYPMTLCSNESPVDRVHMAIVNIVRVRNFNLHSNEDQLDEIGFVKPEDLLNDDKYNLESWARMIIESILLKYY